MRKELGFVLIAAFGLAAAPATAQNHVPEGRLARRAVQFRAAEQRGRRGGECLRGGQGNARRA
jgi:hypothetical protein